MRWVRHYLRMIPRLTAQESLRRATEVYVGTPKRKNQEAQRIQKEWQRRAAGKEQREQAGGLSALVAMHRANEKAREEGTLWDGA